MAGAERVEQGRPPSQPLGMERRPGAHHAGADDDEVALGWHAACRWHAPGRVTVITGAARCPDRARRRVDDGVAEDEVGQAYAEVLTTTRPRGGRGVSGEDGLAERGRGLRIAIEQPGRPIGQELLAMVDEEERRVTRHVGGAIRRVVHRHDQRIRCQPVVGHHLAHRAEGGRRDDDVGIGDGRARVGGDRDGSDPIRPPGLGRERLGSLRMAVEHREVHAGRTWPMTGRWLRPWTPAPISAARGARSGRRSEPSDRDAGDGGGPQRGDRSAVEDRGRQPGLRVVEDRPAR